MHSGTTAYNLSKFTGLIGHSQNKTQLVRDADEIREISRSRLDAQIQSGDYFVTLATALDQLSKDSSDFIIRMKLEDIVSDLIHLQDNYEINRKKQE